MPDFRNEAAYPYGTPGIAGTNITLDWLLADPKRVTRAIANLALHGYFVDRIFAPAGTITGGAVVYDQADENELFSSRDVGRVEPGGAFPLITTERGAPRTTQVEKYGGEFFVTDEARRRNRGGGVDRDLRRLANTIQRKTQQRALAELTAAVTEHNRTAVGTRWDTAAGTTSEMQVATVGPLADLTMVEQSNETLELGYSYNFAIMSPVDWRNFRLAAGGQTSEAQALLADSGIKGVWVTNRKVSGSVYWLSERQVGELGYEVPLSTATWRDQKHQIDWFQSFVLPVVYVTDPFAILETTGHRAA